MEIERKFLPNSLPSLDNIKVNAIIQGYISTSPEIRIRKKNILEENTFFLTIKGDGNLSREETELTISEKDFNSLLTKTEDRIIEKDRYEILLPSLFVAELDLYKGKHESLQVVEVEFKSEADSINFTPPKWFGIEVTNDPRYKNKNLALMYEDEIKQILPNKNSVKLSNPILLETSTQRLQDIITLRPKFNFVQKEASPIKEFQYLWKEQIQKPALFFDIMPDVVIAEQMLMKGYRRSDIERAIKIASPQYVLKPKTPLGKDAAKSAVETASQNPHIQNKLKLKPIER